MLLLALVLTATSTPSPALAAPEDADRDVLCWAFNASEAANARKAGDTDNFNTRMQWQMFFRGVSAERYQKGADFEAKKAQAIEALSLYLTNGGKDLVDAECKARMRVALNTAG